jgi:hypothetical protein
MTTTFHGKVHGKLIELDQDPGLVDGQKVDITVRALESPAAPQPGEGFRRTEGALAKFVDRWHGRKPAIPPLGRMQSHWGRLMNPAFRQCLLSASCGAIVT